MEKIIELLKQVGISEEAVAQISTEFENYDNNIHQKYKAIFESKLGKAKELCLKECDQYKNKLASQVSLFLESKETQVDKRLEQIKAIEDTESIGKLRSIKQLVENIEVASDETLKTLREDVETLNKRIVTLKDEKKRAEQAANKANEIALKLINESKTKPWEKKEETPPPAGEEKLEESDKPKAAEAPIEECDKPKTGEAPIEECEGNCPPPAGAKDDKLLEAIEQLEIKKPNKKKTMKSPNLIDEIAKNL